MGERDRVERESDIGHQSTVASWRAGLFDKAMPSSCFRAVFLCLLVLSGCVGGSIEKERISLGSQPFSPDGKHLLLSIHGRGRIDIYRMNRDGSDLTRLTSNPEDNFDASYSPDGSKIVFASSEGVERSVPVTSVEPTPYKDLQQANLYLMHSDGSHKVRLTNGPDQQTSPIFSPDGQQIFFRLSRSFMDAYSQGSASFWSDSDIYSVNVDGSNLAAVTNERFPALSPPSVTPDGKQILIYARLAYEAYYYEEGFWAFPIDNPQEKTLIAPDLAAFAPEPASTWSRSKSPFGNYNLYNPRFAPDGKFVLFKLAHHSIGGDGIGVTDLASKETEILAKCAAIMESVCSPNGKEILYVCDQTGYREVYELRMMNVDGTDARRIKIQGIEDIGNREGSRGNWVPGPLRRTRRE